MSAAEKLPIEATLRDALAKAREVLGSTRALINDAFSREFEYHRKSDQTWVTEIDLAVERMLRQRLAAAFPDHGFIGEEFAEQNRVEEFTWVIDPIDGTMSLRHRIPPFGTILALLHDEKPVLGLIDLPQLGRLYSGGAGLGAWCNERRVVIQDVANDDQIKSEIISAADRSQYVAAGAPEAFDGLMQRHAHVRTYSDCFGHALAIEGAIGAAIDFDLRIWDIAASQALIAEAGGKMVSVRERGEDLANRRYDVVFGKPRVVDWLISTVALDRLLAR